MNILSASAKGLNQSAAGAIFTVGSTGIVNVIGLANNATGYSIAGTLVGANGSLMTANLTRGGIGIDMLDTSSASTTGNIKIDVDNSAGGSTSAIGIRLADNKNLTINGTAGNSYITVTGDGAEAIQVASGATLDISNVNINVNGAAAHRALNVADNGTVIIRGVNTWDTTQGSSNASETIRNNGTLTLTEGSTLTLKVNTDSGIEATGNETKSINNWNGTLNIIKSGAGAAGYATGHTTETSENTFGANSVTNINLLAGATGSVGYSNAKALTTMNGEMNVTSDGSGVIGIRVSGTGADASTFNANADTSKTNVTLNNGGTAVLINGDAATAKFKNLTIDATGSTALGLSLVTGATAEVENIDVKTNVTVAGGNGRGISVATGSTLKLSGTNKVDTTAGLGSITEAMYVGGENTVFDLLAGAKLTLTSGIDTGLEVLDKGTANINGKLIVNKNATGSSQNIGVWVRDATLNLNPGSATEINVGAGTSTATGLLISHASTPSQNSIANITDDITITSNGTNTTGIHVDGIPTGFTSTLRADKTTTITLNNGGLGAYVNGENAEGYFSELTINGTNAGTANKGLYVNDKAQGGVGELEVRIANGRGVHVNNEADLWIADDALIITGNDGLGGTDGVVVEKNSNFHAQNKLTAQGGGDAVIEGWTGSTLNFDGETTVIAQSMTTKAAIINSGAEMNFNNNLQVQLDGDNIVGLAASIGYFDDATNDTITYVSDDLTIVSNGVNNVGIQAGVLGGAATNNAILVDGDVILDMGDGDGVKAYNDSTINLNKKVRIATNDGIAVAVGGDTATALVNINQTGGNTVQIEGDLIGEGTMADSEMNITMDDSNSYLTGKATRSLHKINLDVLGGSEWNVTGDSQVTKLSNEGIVNMMYNPSYQTITAKELAGAGGDFKMKTDLQKSWDAANVYVPETDRIIIETASSGDHTIIVEDASVGRGTAAAGYLLLVEDRSGGTATFKGSMIETGGIWKYNTIITDENPDTALATINTGGIYGTEVLGHPDSYAGVPTSSHNWYLAGFDRTNFISGNAKANMGMAESLYGSLRAGFLSDDTLLKRLGEMRHMDNEYSGGVWARVRGMRNDMDGEEITGMKTTLFQAGLDKFYQYENKRVIRGFAVDYARNTFDNASTTEGGKGAQTETETKSNSIGLSLYSTTLRDSGHYLDLVAKVGRINTSMDYTGAKSESNDTTNWTYAASVEYGRKNKNEKTGWYVEPQAQLSYGFTKGMDYTTEYGINVKTDNVQSLVGRAGFLLGKEFDQDNISKRSNYYLKAFVLKEFLGKSDISMTDNMGDSMGTSQDMSSTWGIVGLGATMNLNERTHLYVDVEKSFGGGGMKTKWAAQAGLRFAFGGPKKVAPLAPIATAPVVAPHEAFLDTIYFDFDIDTPRADQQGKIAEFAKVAQENPDRTYALVGHTDAIGTDEYNMDLSKRRVDNVKAIAQAKGVPAEQMEETYQGKAEPADTDSTAEGRANNRRVNIFEYTN